MAEQIKPHPYIIDIPKKYLDLEIKPNTAPIRVVLMVLSFHLKVYLHLIFLQDVETSMAHLNMLLSM